jgi:hypothetical protein
MKSLFHLVAFATAILLGSLTFANDAQADAGDVRAAFGGWQLVVPHNQNISPFWLWIPANPVHGPAGSVAYVSNGTGPGVRSGSASNNGNCVQVDVHGNGGLCLSGIYHRRGHDHVVMHNRRHFP